MEVARSLRHGDAAAVWAQAHALGLPGLLGPAGRSRDLALALIVARVLRPRSKLATTRWFADTTLGADLGVADVGTDEVYAAMDWLLARQDRIEAGLAGRHLSEGSMVLFDLSSSWVEGRRCPLAARGYSRDGQRNRAQIELRSPAGLVGAATQQMPHDREPHAGVSPAAELLPRRRPGREVTREEVPLHTGPELVEDGVGNPPPGILLGPAAPRRITWRIKEAFEFCPLRVGQVRRVPLTSSSSIRD